MTSSRWPPATADCAPRASAAPASADGIIFPQVFIVILIFPHRISPRTDKPAGAQIARFSVSHGAPDPPKEKHDFEKVGPSFTKNLALNPVVGPCCDQNCSARGSGHDRQGTHPEGPRGLPGRRAHRVRAGRRVRNRALGQHGLTPPEVARRPARRGASRPWPQGPMVDHARGGDVPPPCRGEPPHPTPGGDRADLGAARGGAQPPAGAGGATFDGEIAPELAKMLAGLNAEMQLQAQDTAQPPKSWHC